MTSWSISVWNRKCLTVETSKCDRSPFRYFSNFLITHSVLRSSACLLFDCANKNFHSCQLHLSCFSVRLRSSRNFFCNLKFRLKNLSSSLVDSDRGISCIWQHIDWIMHWLYHDRLMWATFDFQSQNFVLLNSEISNLEKTNRLFEFYELLKLICFWSKSLVQGWQ